MYQIRNDNEVYIYDFIEQGMTAQKLFKSLDPNATEITLRINSGGGDVFEALALYNWLKGHSVKVKVYIDGLCASAASIIAMAGDEVYMPSNALMMIHNPVGGVYGDSADMAAMSELLNKIRDSIVSVYESRTKMSRDSIIKLMDAETWMNGEEAKLYGFIDTVTAAVKNEVHSIYDDGVVAERERLKALDELLAPGREEIITRAKYETLQSVEDIAVELLKAESKRKDSAMIEGITATAVNAVADCVDLVAEKINRMRGGR